MAGEGIIIRVALDDNGSIQATFAGGAKHVQDFTTAVGGAASVVGDFGSALQKTEAETKFLQEQVRIQQALNAGQIDAIAAAEQLARARAGGNAALGDELVAQQKLEAVLAGLRGEYQGLQSETDKTRRTTDEANERFKIFGLTLSDIGGGVTALKGVFSAIGSVASTVIGPIGQALDRAGDIVDLSARTGAAVEDLSRYELGLKAAGASLDSFAGASRAFQLVQAKAREGNEEAIATLQQFGIGVNENFTSALGKAADVLTATEDATVRTAAGTALLGRGYQGLAAYLSQGSDAMEEQAQLAERLGLALEEGVANKLDAVGDSLGALSEVPTALGTQFLTGLAPALEETSEQVLELVASFLETRQIQALGEELGTWLEPAVAALEDFNARADEVGVGQAIIETLENAASAAKDEAIELGTAIGEGILDGLTAPLDRAREAILALGRQQGGGSPESFAFPDPEQAAVPDSLPQFHANAQAVQADLRFLREEGLSTHAAFRKLKDDGVGPLANDILAAGGTIEAATGGLQRFTTGAGAGADAAKGFADEVGKLDAQIAALSTGILTDADPTASLRAASAAAEAYGGSLSLAAVQSKLLKAEQLSLLQGVAQTQQEAKLAQVAYAAYAEALSAAVSAGKDFDAAQREATEAAEDAVRNEELRSKALDDVIPKQQEAADTIRETARATDELNAAEQARAEISDLQAEANIWQQVLAGVLSVEQAERELAIVKATNNDLTREQAEALIDARTRVDELRESAKGVGEEFFTWSELIGDSFVEALDAVIAGTLDIGDLAKSTGISIGKQLFKGVVDEKLNFDSIFKKNILDLGSFTEGNLGGAFNAVISGAGEAYDYIGSLFGGGGGGGFTSTPGFSFDDIVVQGGGGFQNTPGFSFDDVAVQSGSDSGSLFSLGQGGTFSASGAISGGLAAYGAAQQFGPGIIGDSALGTHLTVANRDAVGSIQNVNEIVSAIVGTAVGSFTGEYAGIVGMAIGAMSSAFGAILSDGVDRDALKNRDFSGAARYVGGLLPVPIVGEHLFGLFGFPTLGTAFRREGQETLVKSETFGGGGDGTGGLINDPRFGLWQRQGTELKFDRETQTYRSQALDTASARGLTDVASQQIQGQGSALFSILFGDTDFASDAGRLALEMGRGFSEFFSRGLEEGMDVDDVLATATAAFRSFAAESGVTVYDAIRKVGDISKQVNDQAIEFGGAGDEQAWREGITAFGNAAAGVVEIFEGDFPRGTQIGLAALQSLEKDGVSAFAGLDQAGKDYVVGVTSDFEDLSKVFQDLAAQGFEINAEKFEQLAQAAGASAAAVGAALPGLFEAASSGIGDGLAAGLEGADLDSAVNGAVNRAISGFTAQIGSGVVGQLQSQLQGNVLDNSAIGQSFTGVFDILNQLKDTDLSAPGVMEFIQPGLVEALAQGRENLQAYAPLIRESAKAMAEIQEAVEEALRPSTVVEFFTVMEEKLAANREGVRNLGATAFEAAAAQDTDLGRRAAARQVVASGITGGAREAALDAAREATEKSPEGERLAQLSTEFQLKIAAAMQDGVVTGAEKADLDQLKAKMDEAGGVLADSMAEAAEVVGDLFDQSLVEAKAQVQSALGAGAGDWGSALLGGASPKEATKAFSEGFRASIAESVIGGMQEALVQSAILEGSLAPLMAKMKQAISTALEDGFISADEQAWIDALGQGIAQETDKTVAALSPTIDALGKTGEKLVEDADEAKKRHREEAREAREANRGIDEQTKKNVEDLGKATGTAAGGMGKIADAVSGFTDQAAAGLSALGEIDPAMAENLKSALAGFEGTDPEAATALKETLANFSGADPAAMGAFKDALVGMQGLDASAADKFKSALAAVGGLDSTQAQSFVDAFQQLGAGISPEKAIELSGAVDQFRGALSAEKATELGTSMEGIVTALDSAGIKTGAEALEGAIRAQVDPLNVAGTDLVTEVDRLAFELAQLGFQGGGVPAAAQGGTFSGSAVVGEAGQPELVTALPGGGFHVTPLSSSQARALMGSGVAGFARGGKIGTIPPGVDPPGNGSPSLDNDDSDSGSEEKVVSVSFTFDAAIDEFLAGGSVKDLKKGLSRAAGEGLLQGMLTAILDPSIEKATEAIGKLLEKAKADGILSPDEIAAATAEASKLADQIAADAQALQPVYAEVARQFGVELQEAQNVLDLSGLEGSLTEAISAVAQGGDIDELGESLRRTTGESVLQGMVDAIAAEAGLEEFQERFQRKFAKAMEDGTIDASEAEGLSNFSSKFADGVTTAVEAAQPAFDAIADEFGLRVQEGLPANIQSALSTGLAEDASFKDFSGRMNQTLFEATQDALLKAFLDETLIGAALGPLQTDIQAIFAEVSTGGKTLEQAMDEASARAKKAVNDVQAMKPLFDEFKGMQEDLKDVFQIQDKTTDSISTKTRVQTEASKAAVDTAKEITDLQQILQQKTTDLGQVSTGFLGMQAAMQLETFEPVRTGRESAQVKELAKILEDQNRRLEQALTGRPLQVNAYIDGAKASEALDRARRRRDRASSGLGAGA